MIDTAIVSKRNGIAEFFKTSGRFVDNQGAILGIFGLWAFAVYLMVRLHGAFGNFGYEDFVIVGLTTVTSFCLLRGHLRGEFRWLSRFIDDYFPTLLIAHFWITAGWVFTGVERLEPLALGWFWSPLLAGMLSLDFDFFYVFGERVGNFCFQRDLQTIINLLAWLASVTLVPHLFWQFFYQLDGGLLHPAREAIGRAAHLGGQTGLAIAFCSLWTLVFLFWQRRIQR